MPVAKQVWVPPTLCQCRIEMEADWVELSPDGISYRHPKPWTITSLELIDACEDHFPYTLQMPDVSKLFDVPQYGSVEHFLAWYKSQPRDLKDWEQTYLDKVVAEDPSYSTEIEAVGPSFGYTRDVEVEGLVSVQHRGYRRYDPPMEPTNPAECLYALLSQHRGQTHGLPCGCQGYQHGTPEGVFTYREHPIHTTKCIYHHDDTVDMQQARADHTRYMAMIAMTRGSN